MPRDRLGAINREAVPVADLRRSQFWIGVAGKREEPTGILASPSQRKRTAHLPAPAAPDVCGAGNVGSLPSPLIETVVHPERPIPAQAQALELRDDLPRIDERAINGGPAADRIEQCPVEEGEASGWPASARPSMALPAPPRPTTPACIAPPCTPGARHAPSFLCLRPAPSRRLPGGRAQPRPHPSTLKLRRAATRYPHRAAGQPVPIDDVDVSETLAGVVHDATKRGYAPEKKAAETYAILQQILAPMPADFRG